MQGDDVQALGSLGGLLIDEIAGWAKQNHEAVAGRAFRWAGPAAAPVRLVHDAVAGRAYRAVRLLGRVAGEAVGGALAPLATRAPVSASFAGSQAVATLDAFLGDRLEEEGSSLALPMTLRSRQGDVRIDRAGLSAAYPEATSRIVVLVHGLGETDLSCWDEMRPASPGPMPTPSSRAAGRARWCATTPGGASPATAARWPPWSRMSSPRGRRR